MLRAVLSQSLSSCLNKSCGSQNLSLNVFLSSKVCVWLVVCICMFVPAILNTKDELLWAEKDAYEEIVFLVFLFAFGALGYLCQERERELWHRKYF